MKYKQCLIGALLAACCSVASAQWAWRDANNVMHFSDQPPPASVPASRIVKAPKGQLPDLRKELAAQPRIDVPAAQPGPRTDAPEKAYEKRRADAAEQAGKDAVAARAKADAAAACDSARANLRVLASGIRVATANADGEPAFLDDAQKAEQVRRNRESVAAHCR